MTSEEKQLLRQGLRNHYGAFSEVARRSNCTPSFVLKVFNGTRNSDLVLANAAQVYKERMEEKARLEKQQAQAFRAALELVQQPS